MDDQQRHRDRSRRKSKKIIVRPNSNEAASFEVAFFLSFWFKKFRFVYLSYNFSQIKITHYKEQINSKTQRSEFGYSTHFQDTVDFRVSQTRSRLEYLCLGTGTPPLPYKPRDHPLHS